MTCSSQGRLTTFKLPMMSYSLKSIVVNICINVPRKPLWSSKQYNLLPYITTLSLVFSLQIIIVNNFTDIIVVSRKPLCSCFFHILHSPCNSVTGYITDDLIS